MVRWNEIAEKALGPEDRIQRSYDGWCDGKWGHLVLSNRKLLFVHEKGLLNKNSNVILDIPYEKVGKIVPEDRYKLDLIDVDGRKHELKSQDIPISAIERGLKFLIKNVHNTIATKFLARGVV